MSPRDLLIDLGLAVLGLAVLAMPWWVPRYHRWLDARTVRKVNARRAQFHAVHFPAEDEERRREAQRWN